MPIYEYCCSQCNHKFELLRTLNQANEQTSCPRCQSTSKRIFSRFASFAKDYSGASVPIAGTSNSCSGCTASSCSSCH